MRDPLIHFAYVYSYPNNPFIDPGEGLTSVISWTGASLSAGDGDVRFGWTGETMGNCLDDPRYLWKIENGNRVVNAELACTMWPINTHYIGVLNQNSPNSYFCMGGLPQWSRDQMGQSDLDSGETIKSFWPGQFFYRSGGDFFVANAVNMDEDNYGTIWDWPYMRINKYMLGGYGSPRTDGMDVIRITCEDGSSASLPGGNTADPCDGVIDYQSQMYQDHTNPELDRSHPDYDLEVQYSNPEVFGAGERGLMPQFPYTQAGTDAWLFGAPDGYRDGVIIVLTSGSDSEKFTEWQG
jgi:hypothetical protein